MKKFLAILAAVVLGVMLASAWAQDDAAPQAPQASQPAQGEGAPMSDEALMQLLGQAPAEDVSDEDIAYAFGFIVGSDLRNQGIQIADTERFAAGLRGGLGLDEPKLTPPQINAALNAYAMKVREQIMATKQEGHAYLQENAKADGVTTTASGLQIKTLKEGEGDTPKEGDVVTVNYEGKLIGGKVFDKSEEGEPLVWDPSQFNVIPGWQEGLKLMKEGGRYELTVPSDLAYGDRPMGEIPGGSTLVFTIDLVDTQTPAE